MRFITTDGISHELRLIEDGPRTGYGTEIDGIRYTLAANGDAHELRPAGRVLTGALDPTSRLAAPVR